MPRSRPPRGPRQRKPIGLGANAEPASAGAGEVAEAIASDAETAVVEERSIVLAEGDYVRASSRPLPDGSGHVNISRRLDSPIVRQLVITGVRAHGGLAEACAAAGVRVSSVRKLALVDEEFGEELEQAQLAWSDETLHRAAVRRAVEGWEEPVFGGPFKDEIVGSVRKYSDPLLTLLLKRHDPGFRGVDRPEISVKNVQQNVNSASAVVDLSKLSVAQLELVEKLLDTGDVERLRKKPVGDGRVVEDLDEAAAGVRGSDDASSSRVGDDAVVVDDE